MDTAQVTTKSRPEEMEHLLVRLFEGYVLSYRSFNLFKSNTNTDLTHRELEHFAGVAQGLGYLVRREKLPRRAAGADHAQVRADGNERRKMDLCWERPAWTQDKGNWTLSAGERVLHLERETDRENNEETLEKLLGVHPTADPARYTVAVLGHVCAEDRTPLCQIARERLDRSELLIVAWMGDTTGRNTEFATCEGWLFLSNGAHKARGPSIRR